MIDSREQPPISQSFFRIARLSGSIVGIWPQQRRNCWTNLVCAFSFAVILIGAVGENLYGFLNLANLVTALEAFCPGSTKAVCVLKLSMFFLHHRRWYEIVQRLRAMLWFNRHDSAQAMLCSISGMANRLTLLLLGSGTATNTAFNVQPLIMGLYRKLLDIPGHMELPFNIM